MNVNYISVKTKNQQDLENILCNFANLYRDAETVNGIELYRKKGEIETFIIRFTHNPDFEIFSFLVNYLVYPMDYLDFKAEVRGFYDSKDVGKYRKLQKSGKFMVYINAKDKQPDNVYLSDENGKAYIFDFGGVCKEMPTSLIYQEEEVNMEDFNHIIDIYPSPENELRESKAWWKFW
ncbi:hypothetical protein [Maribacter sp. 4G9]|uniref:hypothetical protein n=1 Tax=Maribacter sp. 4G9 TaxID=1889777 RepID=UPI000C160620|nr:hypothetical protein [Maribacter sp. 4G9]PIB30622.1 hypothetical protein BFP75_02500 [Maribacter sp. 4G9]